jgi:catechol 2,3-dioxygenase-like lactoylglutathione lyase family enzyme
MSTKSLAAIAVLNIVLGIAPLSAQLAPPNAMGVSIGHVHVNARDIEAQQRFWTQLGGTLVHNEKIQMVQFPGMFINLRTQVPTGGTVGSVVNHIGFHVKNLADWMPKWEAAGLKIEAGNNPRQKFLTAPDDIRVEIIEDSTIATPVAMHHIHMYVPDPLATQAWYIKNFGGVAGKRGSFDTVNVPGTELTLAKSEMQVPTKGRAIDHIGFEIKNLDQFVKNLEANGIHTDAPIRTSGNASKLRLAYITDPWGTNIELTEGLTPAPAQSAAKGSSAWVTPNSR